MLSAARTCGCTPSRGPTPSVAESSRKSSLIKCHACGGTLFRGARWHSSLKPAFDSRRDLPLQRRTRLRPGSRRYAAARARALWRPSGLQSPPTGRNGAHACQHNSGSHKCQHNRKCQGSLYAATTSYRMRPSNQRFFCVTSIRKSSQALPSSGLSFETAP